ncbi:MAG: hypothetical protein ACLFTE_10325 [Salinivenus sp.]
MALPIEVLADLQLAVDGEDISIQGDGDQIVVDLPSLRAGRRLVNSGPFALGRRSDQMDRLHQALDVSGIGVVVRLRGESIARLGKGAEPGLLSRVLDLGAVEVRPARPLLQALRERPLLAAAVLAGLVVLLGWLIRRLGRE